MVSKTGSASRLAKLAREDRAARKRYERSLRKAVKRAGGHFGTRDAKAPVCGAPQGQHGATEP